jgi:hypothetical protein
MDVIVNTSHGRCRVHPGCPLSRGSRKGWAKEACGAKVGERKSSFEEGSESAHDVIDVSGFRFMVRIQDQKNVDVREVPLLKLDSVDIPVDFPKDVANSEVLEEFGHLEMKDSCH